MTRRPALIPLLLVATIGTAAAASAAPSGSRTTARAPQLTATPAAVQPGGTVTLAGRGFPPNADVALLAGPPRSEASRIGSARTGLRGRFTATIRIRPRAAAGRFVALACHDGCRLKASARFRIVTP